MALIFFPEAVRRKMIYVQLLDYWVPLMVPILPQSSDTVVSFMQCSTFKFAAPAFTSSPLFQHHFPAFHSPNLPSIRRVELPGPIAVLFIINVHSFSSSLNPSSQRFPCATTPLPPCSQLPLSPPSRPPAVVGWAYPTFCFLVKSNPQLVTIHGAFHFVFQREFQFISIHF